MLLVESIAASIKRYPSLYGCRTDVLDHYFLSSGNGFEWEDGILVDKHKIRRDRKSLNDSRILSILEPFPEAMEQYKMQKEWDRTVHRFRQKHAAVLATVVWHDLSQHILGPKLYESGRLRPITEFCLLYNIPANVKPDWLEGAREIAKLAASGHDTFMKSSYTDELYNNLKAKNMEMASKILVELDERFGKQ